MNVVFLSPHFPPNFYNFCVRLRHAGANVLGIADEPFDHLHPDLRYALSDYYRVHDMHSYDQLVRAMGYFTHRFGKIDRIDSQNEYWLETEARLRTDFNIPGIQLDSIGKIKRKSEMKKVFQDAGLKPARGRVCRTEAELREFVAEVGYPIVAKPDIGVGAAKTYKIENEQDLKMLVADAPTVDYIMEEYVSGPIVTYDGLADREGNIILTSSLRYSMGVMEAVNADTDLYYYTVRQFEPKLEEAGIKTAEAFGVKERFFHFEFFLMEDHSVVPLEVNVRPPGGLTLDMWNWSNDSDAYQMWADMLVKGHCEAQNGIAYCVNYVGRKDHINYRYTHEEVLNRYASIMIHHERMSPVLSRALGHYGYIIRHPELQPLIDAANVIQERA